MSPKTLDVQLARLLLPLTTLLVWLALLGEVQGFKYHEACHAPPMDMKTRFPLYRLEVDTKITGIPWAYRQNNTIKGKRGFQGCQMWPKLALIVSK